MMVRHTLKMYIWIFVFGWENRMQGALGLGDEISTLHVIITTRSFQSQGIFGGCLVHVGYLNLTKYIKKKLCCTRPKVLLTNLLLETVCQCRPTGKSIMDWSLSVAFSECFTVLQFMVFRGYVFGDLTQR